MPSRLHPHPSTAVKVCNECGLAKVGNKGVFRGQTNRSLIMKFGIMKSHDLCISMGSESSCMGRW